MDPKLSSRYAEKCGSEHEPIGDGGRHTTPSIQKNGEINGEGMR